jgi:hypothetical protein
MRFWVLEQPEGPTAERRYARDAPGNKTRYQSIDCPINPGHRRLGLRTSPINALLPNLEPYDFVWAPWEWACLVQESALALLREAGFTGYEPIPAQVRFEDGSRKAPPFWELKPIGFAGQPAKESGSRVLTVCPGCGLDTRSRVTDPTKFVDEKRWDGSDFFTVEPFLSNRIFITDRVAEALRASTLKGWAVYSLAEMKEAFDIVLPGPSATEKAALN